MTRPAESSRARRLRCIWSMNLSICFIGTSPNFARISFSIADLRQMECSRHLPGTFPIWTGRFPVPFERAPERFPVLGGGFHHHFLDLLLDEPLRQPLQLLRVASVPASLKWVFVVDFDVSHNYGQL